jgi:hypothetical protein
VAGPSAFLAPLACLVSGSGSASRSDPGLLLESSASAEATAAVTAAPLSSLCHWAGFRRAMEAPQVKDLAADIPVLCADGQVREFAGRLLVLSDGLGAALGAMGIFAANGTTGIKPFT